MISQVYLDRVQSLIAHEETLEQAWDNLIIAYHDRSRMHIELVTLASVALVYAARWNVEAFTVVRDSMRDLHIRKNAGYTGDNSDSWANFRECNKFGISTIDGIITRMCDKMSRFRVISTDESKEMVGETIFDTLRDLAAYAIIATCILDERNQPMRPQLFYDITFDGD